jgi:biotin carboxyl carrier protein
MSNTASKKFRASVDDASFDVEVVGDRVRVQGADAVSGQFGSNSQPRQPDTPPSSKQQPSAPTGAITLDGAQFVIAPRGATIDVSRASTTVADLDRRAREDSHATESRESTDQADGPIARAFVALAGDVTWVCIDGEVFTIEVEDAERARRPRAAAGEGLSAPMPATVIRVIAEPGREVKRGETLLLLEAMKMELPVRAPRDGKVKALHCQAGQLVQPGVPLVDLE